jgi:hypothetical protein
MMSRFSSLKAAGDHEDYPLIAVPSEKVGIAVQIG